MDILCVLWNAPTRGRRTLTLDGWAGEVGKPSTEVDGAISELERCRVGRIVRKKSSENDEEITIQSGRMLRDEEQRKRKAKQKQDQRDRVMSPPVSPSCPPPVPGLSPGDIRFQNQKSESEVRREEGEERRKKEKTAGKVADLARPPKSEACWQRYRVSYLEVWKVEPVRNKKTNTDLCGLVDRLGKDLAPEVAGFYPHHQRAIYVTARHPTNLLLRDAEAIRVDMLTSRDDSCVQAKPRSVVELIG